MSRDTEIPEAWIAEPDDEFEAWTLDELDSLPADAAGVQCWSGVHAGSDD